MKANKLHSTPGPWEAENSTDVFTQLGAKNANGVAADSNDGWQVADTSVGLTFVNNESTYLSVDECIANAHLIAAAPEMYELLESLSEDFGENSQAKKEITELLAKARGEQQ